MGALKGIAPILVFVLVASSLANAKGGVKHQFRTVIFLYMLSTFLAAVVAVLLSFVFPVTLKLSETASDNAPQSIFEVISSLLNKIVANPVDSLINANYIGILFWSLLLRYCVEETGLRQHQRNVCKPLRCSLSDCKMDHQPGSIRNSGSCLFFRLYQRSWNLQRLWKAVTLTGWMYALSALIVDPLIAAICLHRNPYPLVFRCLKESGVTAFFTRSSAANIPVNMALCEKLGLDKNIYSVSIPLGATINMDGAAITITVMTLAAANSLGISVERISNSNTSLKRAFCRCCLWCFRCCRRIPSSDPNGMLLVRNQQ